MWAAMDVCFKYNFYNIKFSEQLQHYIYPTVTYRLSHIVILTQHRRWGLKLN